MNRRNLINLLLLIGAALLVTLIIYEPGIETPISLSPLTSLSRNEIRHIRIERVGKQETTLQKMGNGHWQIKTPYFVSANQHRVNSLLQLADTPSLGSFAVGDLDPATFGLSPAEAQLTLNNLVLRFGTVDPLSKHRYVAVADRIHLIDDMTYYSVITESAAFVDHALLPPDSSIEEITLPGLHLWKNAERWQARPESDDITADIITAFLDEWRHSQAVGIEPLDDNDPQGEVITIHLAGQNLPLQFIIVQRQPELKLARPDLKLQYVLPAARLVELPVPSSREDDSDAGTP